MALQFRQRIVQNGVGRTVMTINGEGHAALRDDDTMVTPTAPAGILIRGDLEATTTIDPLGHLSEGVRHR